MRTKDKVLIGLGVLIAASALAMSGSSGADPYLDVHMLSDDPERYLGSTVSVKGLVLTNSTERDDSVIHFVIGDQSGDLSQANKTLNVTYGGVLPDAFGPKMVVVTGILMQDADRLWIQADDIQVGCSSKY